MKFPKVILNHLKIIYKSIIFANNSHLKTVKLKVKICRKKKNKKLNKKFFPRNIYMWSESSLYKNSYIKFILKKNYI